MHRTTEAVSRWFPEGTRVTRPTGGVCLWVELPADIDALKVYRRAMTEKISIAPGPLFSAKQQYKNFIRLNCGNPWTDQIERALRKLGEIIGAQHPRGSPRSPVRPPAV